MEDDHLYKDYQALKDKRKSGLFKTAILLACLGPFIFGFNISAINEPKEKIFGDLKIHSALDKNLFVTVFHLGGLMSTLLLSFFSDSIDRIYGLVFASFSTIVGGILMVSATQGIVFIVGRFFLGLACGCFMMIVPTYISEVSPINKKGFYGTFSQISIVFGIFLGVLLTGGVFLQHWRITYGLNILSAVLLIFGCFTGFLPKSPMQLLAQDRKEDAKVTLEKLRGDLDEEEYESLLLSENELTATKKSGGFSALGKIFGSSTGRVMIMIAVLLQITQQMSGINLIMQFSSDYLRKIGHSNSYYISLIAMGINTLGVFVSLAVIEKWGRKPLLLVSSTGIALFYAVITFAEVFNLQGYSQTFYKYLIAGSVFMVIALFEVGLGPVPWLIVSEMFDTEARATANSISTFTNLSFTLLVTAGSDVIIKKWESVYIFLPFLGWLGLVAVPFLVFGSVETKHKTPDEVKQKVRLLYGLNETNLGNHLV